MSSATTRTDDVDGAIMRITVEKKEVYYNNLLPYKVSQCLPLFSEHVWWPLFLHVRLWAQKYSDFSHGMHMCHQLIPIRGTKNIHESQTRVNNIHSSTFFGLG